MTVFRLVFIVLLALAGPLMAEEAAQRADQLLREGLVHLTQSRGQEAIAQFETALSVYEELGDLRGQAECRLALGQARARLDTYDQALADFQASLELWSRLNAPMGRWMVHFALAETRVFLEDSDRAMEEVDHALRLLADLRHDESAALSVENLRIIALAYGLPVEQLAALTAMVPNLRGVLIGYLDALTRIVQAKILRLQGHYPEARSILMAALSEDDYMAILNPLLLDDIGEAFFEQGDHVKALVYFEQAEDQIANFRLLARRDLAILGLPLDAADVVLPYLFEALRHIAMVYRKAARYEDALDKQQQALAIARGLKSRLLQGALISDMGDTYLQQGRYQRALARYQKSLAIVEEVGSQAGRATVHNQIGLIYTLQGRWEEALRLQMGSKEIFSKMGHRAKEALSLSSMGKSYQALAMYPEALDVFRHALAIAEDIEHGSLSTEITRQIAWLHFFSRDTSELLQRAEEALTLAQAQESLEVQVDALILLVGAHTQAGQFEESSRRLDQTRELMKTSKNLSLQIGVVELIGGAMLKRSGQAELARQAFQKAGGVFRRLEQAYLEAFTRAQMANLHFEAGREAEGLDLLEKASRQLDTSARIHLPELAVSSRQDLAADIAATLVDRHASRDDAETAFQYAERSRARSLLNVLGGRKPTAPKEDHRRRVEDLRQHLETLERDLARESQTPTAGHSARWTHLADQVRQARKNFSAAVTELRLNQPEYASIINVGQVVTIPETQALLDVETTLLAYYVLDARVVAWVIDRQSSRMVDLPIDIRTLENKILHQQDLLLGQDFDLEIAGDLYRHLFEPLRDHVRHQRLIFVPHGVLHSLPFAALWNADGDRFLIEDHTVTYVPSASILRFLARKHSPDAGRLLVMGNPENAHLSGAEQAAESIARIYGTRPFVGAEATESRLRAEIGKFDILHLATHGVVDTRNPRFSHIQLTPGDGHDGRLELHELYWNLQLEGVNLVVLSACKSDLGRRNSGDEILGLTRAFMYAGSPAVITTRWNIDDEASRFLMETFHRQRQSGVNSADALRGAQLATLEQERWSSPYFWAAFALNGDATSVPKGEKQ